jgi:hypothetical protein
VVRVRMSIDRQKKLADLVEVFDGYMAQLKALHQRLEAGCKDPRSFYPFVERDENQRLTAFRLAVAGVFGEESSVPSR